MNALVKAKNKVLLLFLGAMLLAPCRAQTSHGAGAPACTRVHLAPQGGDIAVVVDGQPTTTLSQLRQTGRPITVNCAKIQAGAAVTAVNVAGECGDVCVSADGLEGWESRIGRGNECAFAVNFEKVLVDMAAASANSTPVKLLFPDGGSAEIAAGTFVRYDFFKDKSYYSRASADTKAVNAEGQASLLSENLPAQTGGPLARKANGDKPARFERLTPVIPLLFSSTSGQEVKLVAEGREHILVASTPATLSFANGAVIHLTNREDGVHWRVEKGAFLLTVAGIDCWKAHTYTDQQGVLQWDQPAARVQLRNRTQPEVALPNQPIIVPLTRSTHARVTGGATLDYTLVFACTSYTLLASGGPVFLHNATTRSTTLLSPDNPFFFEAAGAGETGGSGASPFNESLQPLDVTRINESQNSAFR